MGIIRLLLAVSVIAAHAGPLFGSTMLPGNYAVEVFFMVSGFYMSLVLSSKYEADGMLSKFYTNRFLRLYPTYFLVLIGTWAWMFFSWWWLGRIPTNGWREPYSHMHLLPKLGLITANWTMIGNDIRCLFHLSPQGEFLIFHEYDAATAPDGSKWVGDFGTIGQAWSIGLEIWFYMIAPWLVRLRIRHLLVIGLLSAALKMWMEMSGLRTYFFFPAQLVFFVIGMLARNVWATMTPGTMITRLGWFMVALLACFIVFFPFLQVPGERWIFYILIAAAMPSIFAASNKSRYDRWLGNLSYPIYMIHILVMAVVAAVLKTHSSYVTLLVTLFAAIVILHFVEEPLDRWRQKRLKRNQPAT